MANAQAQVTRARTDLARIEELARDGSVSLRERDQAVATLRQAEAALGRRRRSTPLRRSSRAR